MYLRSNWGWGEPIINKYYRLTGEVELIANRYCSELLSIMILFKIILSGLHDNKYQ